MNDPTPMPAAWCHTRRAEIQAYVDGTARKSPGETRTFLLELLAQLKQAEARVKDQAAELAKERAAHQLTGAALAALAEVAGFIAKQSAKAERAQESIAAIIARKVAPRPTL